MPNEKKNIIQGGRPMKVTFDSMGNFENTINWLKQSSNKVPSNTIRDIGREGIASLRANTPIGETGETARGWDVVVETNNNVTEISFVNKAHPESPVNVAKLIDTGHGTGTGGYVPPQPYIRQAMESIFKNAGDKLAKEMSE